MVMMQLGAVVAMMTTLAGAPPAGASQGGAKPVPPQVRQQLAARLPDPGAVGGTAAGKPVFYGENLFEYIDGGAEVYHQYQFVALAHQKYRAGEVELTVDIYDMGNALNAFGIYASERAPGYSYIAVGAEGYLNEPVLNFLQGACYVKLSAASKTGKASPVLERAARSISARIGTGKALPAALALFPTVNRAPRSERFVRTSPLGYDFLAPMFQVDYTLAGKKVTLGLSEAGSARDALARAKRLEEHFGKAGKVSAAASIAPGASRGASRYDGDMLWAAKGRYVALLIGGAPGGDDLFKGLLARLPAQ